jgi:hypothetical protein
MVALGTQRVVLVCGGSALLLLLVAVPAMGAMGPSTHPASLSAGGLVPSDGRNSSRHPAPFTWTNGKVALTLTGESPTFYVASLAANRTNVSVSVLGLAEVAPNGTVVAVGSFSNENIHWNLSWNNESAGGVQVNLTGSAPVGTAQGPWNASELPEQDGGGLGSVTLRLVFHLTAGNAASSPWTVKFDLGVAGWPWVGASDHLGVVLSLHTVGSSSLQPGSDDVEEHANATGSLIATLSWGSTAAVTYANGTNATSTVTSGTSVSSDDQETHIRLLFGGVAGGYPSLYYDPSVTLNPAAIFVGGSNPGTAFLGLFGTTGGLVGAALGVAVVGLLGWAAFRRGSANPRNRLHRIRGPTGSSVPDAP